MNVHSGTSALWSLLLADTEANPFRVTKFRLVGKNTKDIV